MSCSPVNRQKPAPKPPSRMARALNAQCDLWRGNECAYGVQVLWIGQAVRLSRSVGKPQHVWRISSSQVESDPGCARCSRCNVHATNSAPSNEGNRRESQDVLWKTFFVDYTPWREDQHKEPGEALWRNSQSRPAWVEAELVPLHMGLDHNASATAPWNFSPNFAEHCLGFRRRVTPDLVRKLCQQGQGEGAVEVLEVFVKQNSGIGKYLFYSVLKECVVKNDLMLGGQVHALAVKMGFGSDMPLCKHLVRLYCSHGKLREAMDVFRGVSLQDIVMWSCIISAHVKQGQPERAIELYRHMRATTRNVKGYLLVSVLQACAVAGDLHSGKQVHNDVLSSGAKHNTFVCNCLVNMYAKCGSLKDARTVFDGLVEKDVVTWNAMIGGYAKVWGMGHEALSLHSAMYKEGTVAPDAVTFSCLLQACASVGVPAFEKGKHLHSQLKEQNLENDVGCSLVNMYIKCGSVKDARIVFDRLDEKSVVTWTAMIAGYSQQEGMGQEALILYSAMHNEGVVIPDAVTFVCLLQACANVGVSALETGKQLHSQLKDRRLESDVVVGGSLVNMYVKCGNLMNARIVFDGLREKTLVTWNAMISGYAGLEGTGQEALNLYNVMRSEGMTIPNEMTFASLLEACASVGALQQGKELLSEIYEVGFGSDAVIGTSLVKMYANCGYLKVSREVFDRLTTKNLWTWNVLLKGYAEHGEGCMAIQCFDELVEQGLQPNKMTYTCLLTACSHAGLIHQAQQYIMTMEERHGVEPDDQHYICMVDLLGRSGHLDKAEEMLRASGVGGDAVSWRALLSACKTYGDTELGRRCFDHLVKLDPTVSTPYLLMSSVYANAGRWDEAERIERLRKAAGARKLPGKAHIEVQKQVHEFTVGQDRSDVAATLRKMNTRVKEGGHVPQTQLVFRAASEQEKEDALCSHAEKLALAYGLLNTPNGDTLVVTKNLRMCNDCHSSTKIMSRLEKREIVVRDGHKVHRFRNGACSCQDRP